MVKKEVRYRQLFGREVMAILNPQNKISDECYEVKNRRLTHF